MGEIFYISSITYQVQEDGISIAINGRNISNQVRIYILEILWKITYYKQVIGLLKNDDMNTNQYETLKISQSRTSRHFEFSILFLIKKKASTLKIQIYFH